MLTERQQAILDFITEYVNENGFPPSVREIGRQFNIYPATVQDHISALERKGYLQKKRFQSRTLSVSAPSRSLRSGGRNNPQGIPIVGRVAAGLPLLAEENVEDMVAEYLLIKNAEEHYWKTANIFSRNGNEFGIATLFLIAFDIALFVNLLLEVLTIR